MPTTRPCAQREAGPGWSTFSRHLECVIESGHSNDGSVCASRPGSTARRGEGRDPSPVPPREGGNNDRGSDRDQRRTCRPGAGCPPGLHHRSTPGPGAKDLENVDRPTNRRSVLARAKGVALATPIVRETSTAGKAVAFALKEAGRELPMAVPNKVALMANAPVKIDERDSSMLAHLFQSDPLPECDVPSPEIDRLRPLVRTRADLGFKMSQIHPQFEPENGPGEDLLVWRGDEVDPEAFEVGPCTRCSGRRNDEAGRRPDHLDLAWPSTGLLLPTPAPRRARSGHVAGGLGNTRRRLRPRMSGLWSLWGMGTGGVTGRQELLTAQPATSPENPHPRGRPGPTSLAPAPLGPLERAKGFAAAVRRPGRRRRAEPPTFANGRRARWMRRAAISQDSL